MKINMIIEYFKFGLENLRKRKLRTGLTMLGIFVGIASVVALISLGQGLQKYVDDEFAKLGRDKIIIQPKGNFGVSSESTNNSLTQNDLRAIKGIPSVSDDVGMLMKSGKIEFRDEVRFNIVLGIPTDEGRKLFDEMFSYNVNIGRGIKQGDKYKVALGSYYADGSVFTKKVKVGDKVKINEQEFQVVGFYEIVGNPSDDKNIYIPEQTMRDLYNDQDSYSMIYAKMGKNEQPLIVADEITRKLRRERNVKEGSEDFEVQTVEELLKTFTVILNVIQAVLIGIAAISLLVGAIGIMNTMYTAILERTKEIGIMKAIGATNGEILFIFLIEAGILGLVGGAIGIVMGASFSMLVQFIATTVLKTALLKAYFPWYLMVGTLMFSFIIGAASGVVPAWQASKQKPVDSLRYE